jgi:integrase
MTTTRRGGRKQREAFGRVRKLPSGRYQAAYTGPDLALHKPASTFETLMDARAWVLDERRAIDAGIWTAPASRNRVVEPEQLPTLANYAAAWLADRPLKPRTRYLYQGQLKHIIVPDLGHMMVTDITPLIVRQWHASLDPTMPTRRAQAYALLRTILATAVTDGMIPANPCHIRGAGNSKRVHKIKPASIAELEATVANLPDRYGMLVMLAAWCALRFGELTELRRKDVDLKAGKLMIRRAVVVVSGERIVGTPKSDAGVRDVSMPPHLLPALREHINTFAGWGNDGLLFPGAISGEHLGHGTFFKTWDAARKAAGRPDLRFHDLRHTGAVLAAQTGATLAELMNRLGHTTPSMAIRYQHAAEDRDAEIARRLSQMVTGAVTD